MYLQGYHRTPHKTIDCKVFYREDSEQKALFS